MSDRKELAPEMVPVRIYKGNTGYHTTGSYDNRFKKHVKIHKTDERKYTLEIWECSIDTHSLDLNFRREDMNIPKIVNDKAEKILRHLIQDSVQYDEWPPTERKKLRLMEL